MKRPAAQVKLVRLGLLLAVALGFHHAQAQLSLSAVDAMTRVPRTGAAGGAATIHLQAARGEWEAFQVVITGPEKAVTACEVKGATLYGKSGLMVPSPRLFWERYVKVSQSTPRSPLPVGDYADALAPLTLSRPRAVGSGVVNQPVWVDVFVPYNTRPGTYKGTVAVRLGEAKFFLPYTLEVWNFDLPVVPRLRTSIMTVWRRIAEVHGYDPRKEPPSPGLADLLDQYADLLARHRLSIDQIYPTFPNFKTGKIDAAAVEAAMRKHLLHRHAATLSLPIWPEWPYGDPLGADRAAALNYAATWARLLNSFRAASRGYIIMGDLDEPNDAEAYANVRRWGAFFNELEAVHKVRVPLLVTEQPTPDDDWWGRLDGSVDIWVPHFSKVWEDMEAPEGRRDIARRIAAGEEVWTYAALVQMPESWKQLHGNPPTLTESHPPVWALDYPAMNHRVIAWLLPRHGLTGIAYWDTLFASPGVDVWKDAGCFHHPDGDIYNGDGSYIYPATKRRHGVDAPVPSMRLKWLREMADDYDYLMLARDLGLEAEALQIGATFARGFGDWEDNMAKLYEARRELAKLILSKGGRGS
jgi:hypothetical protein